MTGWRGAVSSAAVVLAMTATGAQAPQTTVPQKSEPQKAAPQSPADTEKTPSVPATAHPLQTADVEAFFDGIFPLQLERSDVAGASVLVMKDGKVLLAKGYGYADVKAKKAVDPNTTIFRLASISKLFTWVSVMQLAEQGKVDIDADVNKYLDFKIAPAFGKPVTLRNLMTHTGGFEEMLNDLIVLDAKKEPHLREDLMHNQPKRLFPPGEVPAYSNYGVGIASYIVQRLSGEPFEQYVKEHIFTPLGMTHSSFYQPLEKDLEKLPSEGYREDTTKPVVGFELVEPVGAGGLSSTAGDMGRFGQALLNGGELDGKRILKAETLMQMWTPQYRASNQMPPICMGFYQDWRNHLRWIGHEGDLIAFHSLFFVEPTQKLVLFASYNSANGGGLPRPEVINFFTDRYFPEKDSPQFLKTPVSELKAIEGSYETTRRADSTKLKATTIGGQQRATVDKDGVLHLGRFKDLRGHNIHFKPIGKDLWQEEDGQTRVFAIRDGENHVVRLAFDFPGVQLERVPWYEDDRFVVTGMWTSLIVLMLVVGASLGRTMQRIFFRARPSPAPRPGTIWLTLGPRLAAFCWILLAVGIVIGTVRMSNDPFPFSPALYKWFVLMNWGVGISICFSFFAVVAGVKVWWRDQTRWITMIKFSIVGLVCLFASWFAIHWNLIGPAHRI